MEFTHRLTRRSASPLGKERDRVGGLYRYLPANPTFSSARKAEATAPATTECGQGKDAHPVEIAARSAATSPATTSNSALPQPDTHTQRRDRGAGR